ncbi:MAG: PAS domain-containing sensor histidine kinase [Elusimicrobiota bacterium]
MNNNSIDLLLKSNPRLLFESVIRGIQDALIVTDKDDRILFANYAATALFGITVNDMQNHKCYEFRWLSNNDGTEFCKEQCQLSCKVKQGASISCPLSRELYFAPDHANTRIPLLHSIYPLYIDGKFEGSIKLFRDISAQKEADQQKERFRQMLVHDIRNPITVISGVLSTLKTEKKLKLKDKTKIIALGIGASDNVIDLANEFLELSKLTSATPQGEYKKVKLNTFIKQIISAQNIIAKNKRIKIKFSPGNTNPFINTDPGKLARVFQNVIDNALKHGPAGEDVNIKSRYEDKHITIAVNNTGSLIPANEIKKIFEPFYVGSKEARMNISGIGLGLAFASMVVTQHNGKIWAESNLNSGTTFYIQLPTIKSE